MKISFIMAVYNGEKYIIEQLDSVLGQTRALDEVIIIDDKSTDKTYSMIQNYIKTHDLHHWVLEKNKKNIGYQLNFKKALEKASGDIIFLSDQDDKWLPTKVEEMVSIMEENPHILSLGTSFYVIDKHSNRIEYPTKKGYSNYHLIPFMIKENDLVKMDMKLLCQRNFCQGCTMAISKSVSDEWITCIDANNPHDWEMNIIASSHDGCYFLNKPLIEYRIHDNNTIGLENTIYQGEQYYHHRVEDRVEILKRELPILMFCIHLSGFSIEDKIYFSKKYDYIVNRIDLISKHQYFRLLKNLLMGKYFRMGTIRTAIGDIIAAIK